MTSKPSCPRGRTCASADLLEEGVSRRSYPEALRRHGERFGWECVQEIADFYGVDLTATTKTNRGRGRATGTRGLKRVDTLLNEDDLGQSS
jgi:hypothetical protein